eukprot:jgi/Mesen1/2671/ME000167S01821
MDFQPRMGIITRTLSAASPELLHFFILWLIVFVGYATFGHLVFGRTIDQFRSLASSLVGCFYMMLQDDDINQSLMQLKGLELAAGVVFFWTYIIFVDFVLLNLVVAIVIDAFMEVKASACLPAAYLPPWTGTWLCAVAVPKEAHAETAPTMPTELFLTFGHWGRQLMGPFKTDRNLLHHLRDLGAHRTEQPLMGPTLGSKAKHILGLEHDDANNEKQKEEQMLKTRSDDLDAATLLAVLERSNSRRGSRQKKIFRKDVLPKETAELLLQNFGQKVLVQPPPRMHARRRDMDQIKEMLTFLVEAAEESKQFLQQEVGKLREEAAADLDALKRELSLSSDRLCDLAPPDCPEGHEGAEPCKAKIEHRLQPR